MSAIAATPADEALALRSRVGNVLRRSAWAVALVSLFAPAFGTRLMSMMVTIDSEAMLFASLIVPPILGIAVAAIVHAFGSALYRQGLRARAPNAEAVLAADSRAPVVYLRPFDEDRRQARSLLWASFLPAPDTDWAAERAFVEALHEIGPLVAIGRPGDVMPTRGFARMVAAPTSWQGAVAELLDRAAAVLLVPGNSPGVQWELEQVLRRVQLPKVAIAVPSWKGFDYEGLRARLEELTAHKPPSLPPTRIRSFPVDLRALITFGPDGRPVLHDFPQPGPPPRYLDGFKKRILRGYAKHGIFGYPPMHVQAQGFLLDALRPWFKAHGIDRSDPRRPWMDVPQPNKWARRGKTLVLAILWPIIVLVVVGGIWAWLVDFGLLPNPWP